MKYHPYCIGILTHLCYPQEEQCQAGSLTGAVASKRVTEAFKGTLSAVGNRALSAKAQGCLTVRPTSQTEWKHGLSDPAVARGSAVAQRIKGTPGITGLSPPRVHIDEEVWHLNNGVGQQQCCSKFRLITVKP